MSYPLKPRDKTCVDCKKAFKTMAWNTKRCDACRQWNGKPTKAEKPKGTT